MSNNRAPGSWMLYGATGYTGTLIAEEAVRRGHKPILAARNAEKLRVLADRLGLKWCAFPLEDKSALLKAAESVELMLHSAGPFAETCVPMMDACLAGKTHYLDISNEISVLQAAQVRHRMAVENGLSIIPGVGFGTVASNCLVRHVCAQIINPVSLEIVMSPYVAQRSAGAAKSTLETIAHGGYVRRDGILVRNTFGSGAKRIRIANGEHNVIPVPSGDLEAAYIATGIANITVYMTTQINPTLASFVLPFAQKLLSWDILRQKFERWMDGRATSIVEKPVNTNQRSWIWVRACDCHDNVAEAMLETGEGYAFTAAASVLAAEWVLGKHTVGSKVPATAFGTDFVFQIDSARMYDCNTE